MDREGDHQGRHLRLVKPDESLPLQRDIDRLKSRVPELPATRNIAVILAEAGVAYAPGQDELHPVTNQDFRQAVPERRRGRATRIFNNIARLIGGNGLSKLGEEPAVPLEVLEVLAAPESGVPEARPRLERLIGMGPADTAMLRSVIDHAKNPPGDAV